MGEKLIVGPINKGLRNDRTAFVIDNDSFPTLINAYQWRGRVKRKRGTSLLNRLSRFLETTNGAGSLTVTITPTPITSGIISINVVGPSTTDTFTDPGGASPVTLLSTNPGATAILDRATGILTITTSQINSPVIYFPSLPVMGLEDLNLNATQFPGTLAFDTKYAYNILTAFPYSIYDVSFYKNPAPDATNLPGYVPKGTWTRTTWNGQDYQQFFSTNYQGAFWVTNGINVPFNPTNIGMQFKPLAYVVNVVPGPPATAQLGIVAHGLVVGDFVFINEVQGTTGINFQTGYVITVVDGNNVIVEFPNATLGGVNVAATGIAQYLTNRSDPTKDCIRWYDGDPTSGNPLNQVFVQGNGWVNFMPPISQAPFSIDDAPPAIYYLVGARMIVNFKDRLLFLGPVIQTSAVNALPIYLQDTVIYSQNGTPYYTASYTNTPNAAIDTPTSATNVFHPILVPVNQTAVPYAYFDDSPGFGGNISLGVAQPMITVSTNEDVLIIGFNTLQVRMVYTGSDIIPFNFFVINSELGSGSTFSTITMDQGVITRGTRGYVITNQTSAQRIDLEIPDEVFELNLTNNGNERFCAQRDFINEWIYFTYPVNSTSSDIYRFPNQTLQYNYRDLSWAIMNETYTTYGAFRRQTGFIWSTVGLIYPTWSAWNEPWDAGNSTLLQQEVIAGNQQGFVLVKDEGTGEGTSLYIQNIVGSVVTAPNHGLNQDDYFIITGALGAVGTQINGQIFSVSAPITANSFQLNPPITSAAYLGGGFITRLYVPLIQTKQFPVSWGIARKTRLGPQQYLLTATNNAQITLLIFLSQNSSSAYNNGKIVPDPLSLNNSLIYSTVLYTCPESTNLGLIAASSNMLDPANTNLQMVTAIQQSQIWHRVNTSLIGDTIQLGFTLSDAQMRALDPTGLGFAITNITQATFAVLTTNARFETGQLVLITGVVGMTQLNGNIYQVITSTLTTVTLNVNSLAFSPYMSGGLATPLSNHQFAEIELHSFMMDISPSQVLA